MTNQRGEVVAVATHILKVVEAGRTRPAETEKEKGMPGQANLFGRS